MNIKKDFGTRIKELRLKKGITQYELAEKCAIDPKHISHIETGRSFPKADLIEKLASALDVEYIEFFRIEHLKDRQFMLEKLHEIINNATDKELSLIFKLVLGISN